MQVAQTYIVSPSGKKLTFHGKKLMEKKFTYQVTIVNNSHWAYVQRTTYMVIAGTSLTVPLTWLHDSDYTCVSATNATISQYSLTIPSVNNDMTVTLSDVKYRVSANLADTTAVNAITPSYQFVLPNTTATFTLTYQTGYSQVDVHVTDGTVSGNVLSVTAATTDQHVQVSTTPDCVVTVQNTAPYISSGSTYTTRPGGTVSIPITYLDSSDISCISVENGVLSGSTITVSNVTSDRTVKIKPVKVQISAASLSPTVITSVSPTIQYVYSGYNATVNLTYASGYDASKIRVNKGSVSGSVWTIPPETNVWAISATVEENVNGYTYFKLDVTKLRSNSDNIFQLSEWELYDQNGNKVALTYVDGTPGTSSSEYPVKMFDGSTSTKWCVRSSSCYVICRTSSPILPSRYRLATANDTATYKRNPVSWTISASAEPVTTRTSSLWTVIDTHVDDTSIPVANYTYISFNITYA